MSFYKKVFSLTLAGIFLVSLAVVPSLSAQQDTGSGLQLSPTRTELEGQPGETKNFTITVKNVTQGVLYAKAFLNDFEPDGTSGNPKLITDEGQSSPYSVKKMIDGLQDFELEPGKSKTVNLTVNIPSNATPGAYFGAVRYAAVPPAQKNDEGVQQVALTASVAHLVFVNVPGDVVEQIELQKLDITNDAGMHGIFFSKPTKASLAIKNLGNGFSRPFGTVSIFSSSDKEVFRYDVNSGNPKGFVLPNSVRVFDNNIGGISKPGRYKAVASVAYGNGGEVVNYTKTFWYLPLWFIAVVIVVLILIIVGGWILYKKYVAKRFGK